MPHFEIYVADVNKAKTYYGGLFGWSFTTMPGGEDGQGNTVGMITPTEGAD